MVWGVVTGRMNHSDDSDENQRHRIRLKRRRFITLAIGFAASTAFLTFITPALSSRPAVRPPGVVNEENLLALCIRCNRCADACPTKGITPAKLGQSSVGTPVLTGYCVGDICFKCIEACPSGALQYVSPKKGRSSVAEINQRICQGCHHPPCVEICPFDAIRTGPRRRGKPMVIEDACLGCALCVNVCPVEPKAIAVRPIGADPVFR